MFCSREHQLPGDPDRHREQRLQRLYKNEDYSSPRWTYNNRQSCVSELRIGGKPDTPRYGCRHRRIRFCPLLGAQYDQLPRSLSRTGVNIFSGCINLKTISVPEGVESIPNNAFNGAEFTTIRLPDTLTAIGTFAFANNSCISAIQIPNSVTAIGTDAFENCTKLTA